MTAQFRVVLPNIFAPFPHVTVKFSHPAAPKSSLSSLITPSLHLSNGFPIGRVPYILSSEIFLHVPDLAILFICTIKQHSLTALSISFEPTTETDIFAAWCRVDWWWYTDVSEKISALIIT